jgi:hypothetical protein
MAADRIRKSARVSKSKQPGASKCKEQKPTDGQARLRWRSRQAHQDALMCQTAEIEGKRALRLKIEPDM